MCLHALAQVSVRWLAEEPPQEARITPLTQLPEMLPPGDFSAAHAVKSGIFDDEASVSLKDPVK